MITLSWPPSILNPNNRAHWARKAKAKSKYREECFYIAKGGSPFFMGSAKELKYNIPLTLIFHPPTKRKYDIDNLLASMKSGLDGIADAWGINDTRFRPITIDFGPIKKGGAVVISVNQNTQ